MKEPNIKTLMNLSLEELFKYAQSGMVTEPIKVRYPLDTAFANKLINIAGNFISIIDASSYSAYMNIGFNRSEVEKIKFTKGLAISTPFDKLFITSPVQAGEWIDLLISSFDPLFKVFDNRSAASSLLQDVKDELVGASSGTDQDQVTVGTAAVSILATNSSRKAFIVQAAKANTDEIYIGFTSSVTTTKTMAQLQPGQSLILDDYTGTIYAISGTAGQILFRGEW